METSPVCRMVAEKFTVYPCFSDFRERQFYLSREMANNTICGPRRKFSVENRERVSNDAGKTSGATPGITITDA